jgi:sugar-specific transcriptional regulator TrmB
MEESRVLRYVKAMSLVKAMLMDAIKIIEAEESELISEMAKRLERSSEQGAPTATAECPRSAREMVLSIMEPGKAYTARDIKRLISERHSVNIPMPTLYVVLRRLVNKGRAKRVRRGVYQLAQ